MGNLGKKRSNRLRGIGNNQNHPAAPLPEPYDQSPSGGKDPPVLIQRFPCKHGEAGALQHTVDIKRHTLKIEPDQKDTEKYVVEFTFNAHVAGRIQLCFFELVSRTTKELCTITKDVEKGLNQKFIQEDGIKFPSHKFGYKEVYHLEIKAQATEDGSKKCISQTTVAVFEEVKGKTEVRVKNQMLLVNGKTSVYVDLDGFHYPTQFYKNDRYGGCRICYLRDNPGTHEHDLIGKMWISDKVIGKGSDDTVVFEGTYDGWAVAVKRIKKAHRDVGEKEIQILMGSDQHPNIARFYAKEEAHDYVFIALERCECSVHDLISSRVYESGEYKLKRPGFTDVKLWKCDGIYPLEPLLKLMRDAARGVAHLHKHGIVHSNLKPQNVLIHKDTSLTAKLSNYSQTTTGIGTPGWQAPELLRKLRQTHSRASDVFSLGIFLFFCITGGRHPFGDNVDERDVNIMNNTKTNLPLLDDIPEAHDLIYRLLHPNPKSRPTAAEVYNHPLFWGSKKRLSFLREASDRVDLEVGLTNSKILESLESLQYPDWKDKIDTTLKNDLEQRRGYDYNSVCHLLRAIRNKFSHYGRLSKKLERMLGPIPAGFDGYFSSRFPKLLMEVYKVLKKYTVEGEPLYKYYEHGRF